MVRTAIIGMGIRGMMYAQGLAQNQDAELVGITEINPQTLKVSSQKWKVPGYRDIHSLLGECSPDAVIICTPDFLHYEPAIHAAERGIHLLIEKPLATTENEAAKIVDVVRSHDIICQVAFENRWNPPFVQLKNTIDSGDLGNISLVNARLDDTIWVPTQMISWAGLSSVGWFLLPHILDLAIWLSGKKPIKIYAVANQTRLASMGINTYDTICTTITFEDGMQALFENSWVLPESSPAVFDFRFAILGDKGAVHINAQEQMIHQFSDRFTYPGSLFLDIHGQTRGFPLYMLDSFIESVKCGKEPLASVEEGYIVTRTVEAVHQSIRTGEPVIL